MFWKRLNELMAVKRRSAPPTSLRRTCGSSECRSLEEARAFINDWLSTAWASEIDLPVKFADKLGRHVYGLLNCFKHRITTGKVEGINNKIKVLKRQAYGYRDTEYFKLGIYTLHESRYALL